MMLVDPARRRLSISLQLTDSGPKEPVRVHLDLYTREQARHVERLAGWERHPWMTGRTRRTRTSSSCVIRTAMNSA
jgi:hypothetical protein